MAPANWRDDCRGILGRPPNNQNTRKVSQHASAIEISSADENTSSCLRSSTKPYQEKENDEATAEKEQQALLGSKKIRVEKLKAMPNANRDYTS